MEYVSYFMKHSMHSAFYELYGFYICIMHIYIHIYIYIYIYIECFINLNIINDDIHENTIKNIK